MYVANLKFILIQKNRKQRMMDISQVHCIFNFRSKMSRHFQKFENQSFNDMLGIELTKNSWKRVCLSTKFVHKIVHASDKA